MSDLNHLPSLTALRAFHATARLGSMQKAASSLFVTPSSISHQIRNLEQELKTPLFIRRFRALQLTDEGDVLYQAVHSAFNQIATSIENIARKSQKPALTIYTSPLFATKWLLPKISEFEFNHPGISIRVETTQIVELERGNPDIIFRYSNIPPESAESSVYPLKNISLIPVCAPEFYNRNPISTIKELTQQILLHDDGADKRDWVIGWEEFFSRAGYPANSRNFRGKYFTSTYVAIEAALAGQGWVLAIEEFVERDLAAGRLVRPLELSVLTGSKYWLHVRNSPTTRQDVDVFTTWIMRDFMS